MSRNTAKIEKALGEKGITATVTWSPMAKEDADGGIDGYHSDEVQTSYYKGKDGRRHMHSGWLGYSLNEALEMIAQIEAFEPTV